MKTLRILGLVCMALLATAVSSPGQTTNFTVNQAIPDNDPNGLASSFTLSYPGMTTITDLDIRIDIAGAFNGDLLAYLTDGTNIAYLLNRVGRSATQPFGYANGGFNVTLDDSAPNGDIHNYQLISNPGTAPLTGTWAPDARASDPAVTLDTTARTSFLGTFSNANPNATWTLFISDNSPSGLSTLQGWGLTFVAVPEPSTWALILGSSPLVFLWARRRARKK